MRTAEIAALLIPEKSFRPRKGTIAVFTGQHVGSPHGPSDEEIISEEGQSRKDRPGHNLTVPKATAGTVSKRSAANGQITMRALPFRIISSKLRAPK